jgi:iron complex transport system ATP-binding protein
VTVLDISNLCVTLGNREVLHDVSLQIGHGELVGLIGPNGAGKTSLMRAALGLIPGSAGSSLTRLSAGARARSVAWIPQSREIAWPVAVERVVALGRLPYLPRGQALPAGDRVAVEQALRRMGLWKLRAVAASRLSGGEQARVLIARALAQDTPLLMADEPVAGLDPAYQIATMQTFRRLADEGRSVLLSLHDLGLAARHCTRLVLLADGRLHAQGTPREVLTAEIVGDTFGVTLWHRLTPDGPVCQPLDVLQ